MQPPAPSELAARFLPEPLAERVRVVRDGAPKSEGVVLYWMRTAMRAQENPALDAALHVASALSLPLLVYQGVSERYPYASDRHHTFMLEGAREVQRDLRERGVAYALHVERPGHRGAHLRQLAERAALVITEDMPVAPLRGWTDHLAQTIDTPLWCVDTACLVPMRLCVQSRVYDRAYAFRRSTAWLRRHRLGQSWDEAPAAPPADLSDLPFSPVDLRNADLGALCAECDIDHSIGPVPHTKGGSSAGYSRWELFLQRTLPGYDRTRHDPLRMGTSRMSPYLRYGQVSPFRLAREVNLQSSDGARMYLDELLVWREMAYGYCFHEEDHYSMSAVPGWALRTLRAHERDPRERLPTWEQLRHGRTGDALWDTAQQALLAHGELHHSLRLSWGKALLRFTRTAREALHLLIELNHRLALDGRDPASYAGILWCLGQFDRPSEPPLPVYGMVRPVPTGDPLRYFDMARFRARFLSPRGPKVAVIGASPAGLACARTLFDHRVEVRLFAVGAPFSATTPVVLPEDTAGLEGHIASWLTGGVLSRGGDEGAQPTAELGALLQHLAEGCPILEGEVGQVQRTASGWRVLSVSGQELGTFDLIVAGQEAYYPLCGDDAEQIGEEEDFAAGYRAGVALAGRILGRG